MEKSLKQSYAALLRNLGQLLALVRLYNLNHPVFKERANQIYEKIVKLTGGKQSLVLAASGGLVLINGEKVEFDNTPTKHFVEKFDNLHIGSLEFEPGFNAEELSVLISLMTKSQWLPSDGSFNDYFKKQGAHHIIARAASYKLVKEDEKVVKEGGVIDIGDLPADIINRFSHDLASGNLKERLPKEEKTYQALAHDPMFLSGLVVDSAKRDEHSPDEVAKVLWLIGDYLINEISTAREEDVNRKVMEGLKDHLLTLWEKRKDKERWKDETEKTFDAINAALELKAFILLYKKHKKELDSTLAKIKKIMETLPQDSLLYKKAKEDLDKMGVLL